MFLTFCCIPFSTVVVLALHYLEEELNPVVFFLVEKSLKGYTVLYMTCLIPYIICVHTHINAYFQVTVVFWSWLTSAWESQWYTFLPNFVVGDFTLAPCNQSAMVVVFTPQKSANTTSQAFCLFVFYGKLAVKHLLAVCKWNCYILWRIYKRLVTQILLGGNCQTQYFYSEEIRQEYRKNLTVDEN